MGIGIRHQWITAADGRRCCKCRRQFRKNEFIYIPEGDAPDFEELGEWCKDCMTQAGIPHIEVNSERTDP